MVFLSIVTIKTKVNLSLYENNNVSNITQSYIGSISEDELAEYKEQGNDGYSLNDQIGKAGAESYLNPS